MCQGLWEEGQRDWGGGGGGACVKQEWRGWQCWDPEASEAALEEFCIYPESKGEPLRGLKQGV